MKHRTNISLLPGRAFQTRRPPLIFFFFFFKYRRSVNVERETSLNSPLVVCERLQQV